MTTAPIEPGQRWVARMNAELELLVMESTEDGWAVCLGNGLTVVTFTAEDIWFGYRLGDAI